MIGDGDFGVFVDPRDFAEIWRTMSGEFTAIFENEVIEVLGDASPSRAGVAMANPLLIASSADVERLTITPGTVVRSPQGKEYRVKPPIAHDGAGVCRIFLTA